ASCMAEPCMGWPRMDISCEAQPGRAASRPASKAPATFRLDVMACLPCSEGRLGRYAGGGLMDFGQVAAPETGAAGASPGGLSFAPAGRARRRAPRVRSLPASRHLGALGARLGEADGDGLLAAGHAPALAALAAAQRAALAAAHRALDGAL